MRFAAPAPQGRATTGCGRGVGVGVGNGVAAGTCVAGGGSITAGPDWVTSSVGELVGKGVCTVPATTAWARTGLPEVGDPPTVTAMIRARPNAGNASHAMGICLLIWPPSISSA